MSHGKHESTVDFCKNKTKADPEICIYHFENENEEKFIRREVTKMITNCILSLHLVTKIRDSETHETRKFYCLSNMRHAKHLSGIETLKTD